MLASTSAHPALRHIGVPASRSKGRRFVVFEKDRPELPLWRAGITEQLPTPPGGAQGLGLFRMVL